MRPGSCFSALEIVFPGLLTDKGVRLPSQIQAGQKTPPESHSLQPGAGTLRETHEESTSLLSLLSLPQRHKLSTMKDGIPRTVQIELWYNSAAASQWVW